MTIDYYVPQGLNAERDYPALVPDPTVEGFGENHAFWLCDPQERIHLNVHFNTWDERGCYAMRRGKLYILTGGGRMLLLTESGFASTPEGPGSATITSKCLQPFRRWTLEFNGMLNDVTAPITVDGSPARPVLVPASFRFEMEMIAPAWQQGALTPGGLGPVKDFIGGQRYEQLFRFSGTVEFEGAPHQLSGFGNRTHRWGMRNYSAMLGHCWGAAMFPGGLGFGFQCYPDDSGAMLWSEACLIRDDRIEPAEVIAAPWLADFHRTERARDIVLKDSAGQVLTINGEMIASCPTVMTPGRTSDDDVIINQSVYRYCLGQETTVNMMERSIRRKFLRENAR
jgi:hypothetical protein